MYLAVISLHRSLSLSVSRWPFLPLTVVRNKVTGQNGNKKLSRHNEGEDVIALSVGGLTKGTRLYVTISISSPDPRATRRPPRPVEASARSDQLGVGAATVVEWPL